MKLTGTFGRGVAAMMATGGLVLGSALALGTVAAAAPDAPVQLTLSQESGLASGQKITVTGSGADPQMGYYLSTCVTGTSGPTGPDCVGGPDSTDGAVWLSTSPGATAQINEDGTFTADLSVTQKGVTMDKKEIDCDETPCSVTLFGDHRNGFVNVTDTPIAFGPAQEASQETVEATAQEDSGSDVIWWIVGGVVVVAVVGGGAVLATRKS